MTADAGKRILEKMLERLYAGLANGPLMNCRPHASRQRIDLRELGRLEGPDPSQLLPLLLGKEQSAKYVFRKDAADGSQAIWNKLRAIADDARTYEQDTGVQALYVGFPLLQLPPDSRNSAGRFGTKRILAPVAFVPVQLSVKATRPPSLSLEAAGDGVDLVVPNAALLAWVQQVSGKKIGALDADEEGKEPWREIDELVAAVCGALELPRVSTAIEGSLESTTLVATPRADDDRGKQAGIVTSAVLGLFPAANQGLLSDLEALVEGEAVQEPLRSFLRVGSELGLDGGSGAAKHDEAVGAAEAVGAVASEHCVSDADPCQVRAVRLARRATGLVIHGPPGTGKSQTITNIVADHLSKGDRVLFVCDKRTALDVVHYRLQALGLGNLCAVVHDAQRDQRELYRAVREQLEALPEAQTNTRAQAELEAADRELKALHAELSAHAEAVSKRPNGGAAPSFHELVGQWFSLSVPDELSGSGVREIAGVGLEQLSGVEREVREVLSRGKASSYPSNPWTEALGTTVAAFVQRSKAEVSEKLVEVVSKAQRVDAIASGAGGDGAGLVLDVRLDLPTQGEAYGSLVSALDEVRSRGCSVELARFAAMPAEGQERAGGSLEAARSLAPKLGAEPLDGELAPVVNELPKVADLALWAGRVASFLQVARKWYGFLFFGRRGAARGVLERFGLLLSAETAERLSTFLTRLKLRVLLQASLAELRSAPSARLLPDAELTKAIGDYEVIFRVLGLVQQDARLRANQPILRQLLSNVDRHEELRNTLARLAERAVAVHAFSTALERAELFGGNRTKFLVAACRGEPVYPSLVALMQRQDSIEHVLRIGERLKALPSPLSDALLRLLDRGTEEEPGWLAVKKGVLAGVIAGRLASEPALLSTDGERLRASYQHYRELEQRRRALGLQVVLHRSIERQRERLLASTGSRLNTLGADVRRRLVSRGERAMRLRQVIQQGSSIEGGDPLFDLRPVWMASPEVVAQLLPRSAVFDVVIFDEASQCRLEEALPVLTRAKRVVIAGDPKQLPPTRFFESAVSESQESEVEGDQELFEAQQSETEDLLTAALNLSIEQAYLDVHYRSSNADLIGFSNTHFYDARLQPIPAHPKNFAALPPLKLIHAQGTYDKRANVLEARRVVAVVKELLAQPEPPSIGIACFNLTQRDCINEALADAAEDDHEFGARLATERNRAGKASFEGLFVKNLENVQGDERDHLIISTTYGPDPAGKFYRRFGPLAQAGGGRRLNVLVTRARQQVHIVTSIPPSEYRATQAVPDGKQPNGALLLYGYLSYAERLERVYADELARRATAATQRTPECRVLETTSPSELAVAVAQDLQQRYGIGSDVHWGNEGFGVDAALAHPQKLDDVTVGVICDGTRFAKAPDPVQWDVFRLEVLKAQGWELSRVWSPQLFRDPEGTLKAIQQHVAKVLEGESKPSAPEPVEPEATALN